MVERQFGTILELGHCSACLLQKFLSSLPKVFHFGNKLLCHLEGFGSLLMISSFIYVQKTKGLDWSRLEAQSF
jgi:hypothetical protein